MCSLSSKCRSPPFDTIVGRSYGSTRDPDIVNTGSSISKARRSKFTEIPRAKPTGPFFKRGAARPSVRKRFLISRCASTTFSADRSLADQPQASDGSERNQAPGGVERERRRIAHPRELGALRHFR